MIRGVSFCGFFVEEHHFLHLQLLTVFLAQRYSILPRDGVSIQRKHLVGSDIDVPSKFCLATLSIKNILLTNIALVKHTHFKITTVFTDIRSHGAELLLALAQPVWMVSNDIEYS